MRLKNEQIVELYEALEKITSDKEQVLSVGLAYKLLRAKQLLKEEAQLIYTLKKQIWLKYGTIDEDKQISIAKEQLQDVVTEISLLYGLEVDIDIPTVKLSELDGLGLNLEEIDGLKYIINPENK